MHHPLSDKDPSSSPFKKGGVAKLLRLFILTHLTFLILFCSGCYWHFRNASELPASLKVLYLDTAFVESRFSAQVQDLLQSLRITLAPTPQAAPYTLHIFNYSLQHNNPSVSTTNVAITYVYTLTMDVSITDARGKAVVPPHRIVATRSITVNTHQIFTINSTSVFQQDLQREGINLLYYWLTSAQTQKRVSASTSKQTEHIETIHATPDTTTVSTS